jgi:hypothetical protein
LADNPPPAPANTAIVVRHLTRRFGQFVAVDDIGFDVAREDLRVPRQQRRRQVDDHPHAGGLLGRPRGRRSSAASTYYDPAVKRHRCPRFSLYELLTVDRTSPSGRHL